MALPESKSKILEDGTEALLEAENPEVVTDDTTETGEGDVEYADLSAVEPPKEEPAKPAVKQPAAKKVTPPAADDELPDDLKDKTPAQLAKMLKDAQTLIGRQGSELGEVRRRADQLIQADLEARRRAAAEKPAEKKAEPEPEIDDAEIFADPKKAIAKMVENHPLIKEIRETLGRGAAEQQAARATAATERFNAAHPDSAEIMQDPEFRKWVTASKVRTALLHRAHSAFDFDAGDEVFSTWKALRGLNKSAGDTGAERATSGPDAAEVKAAAATMAKAAQAKRQAAAQAAAAPTGGASAAKETGAKKIYRRADVLRLMEEEPERYELLSPEIDAAYREGRVR